MRQPSPTGTSSTVSCEGCWPLAEVLTWALASLSVTVILPIVICGSLTLAEALLERHLARQADLLELVDELRGEDAVAERLVVLRGRRLAEVGQRLADLLLVGRGPDAAAGE